MANVDLQRCPHCGANLALVGRVHNCRPVRLASSQPSIPVVKRGRPRIGAEDDTLTFRQPWKKLNMSRRTWYRRRKEGAV